MFNGLHEHMSSNIEKWKEVYDSMSPERETFPEPYHKLHGLEVIAVLKCIRPDKVTLAIQDFIQTQLGDEYLSPPQFDILSSYNDSLCSTPLIFILSPGTDPVSALRRFADQSEMDEDKLHVVSLGQGQGEIAENMIQQGAECGWWVVLQNCHLAESFMSRLEILCHQILPSEDTHKDFRLWLTSYPSPVFPVSLLQDGIKITDEPPRGLRANLLKTYNSNPINDPEFYSNCKELNIPFHKLLFALAFFHALIQERRSFGPLGWNVPYEFNESDIRISVLQLQMMLNECGGSLPIEALVYLTGECNYGGRVTDARDRRLLHCLLTKFYNKQTLEIENYSMCGLKEYCIPVCDDWKEFVDHIGTMPLSTQPRVFGLHQNADITKDSREVDQLFRGVLALEPQISASVATEASTVVVQDLTMEILSRMPPIFDMTLVEDKYPINYSQSMNTVLRQELLRYNRLLSTVKNSMKEVMSAVNGECVMSAEIETTYKALVIGQVPPCWLTRSYPTLKNLARYVADLLHRLKFFNRWIEDGMPDVFWFSGFFFPNSFLTGLRQNFSRKTHTPIDRTYFKFMVLGKEIEDILCECHKPNFIELPENIEYLPTPALRG
ncbi:unnamed protein product, partial [Meganyctiphanes norvegica]